MSLDNIRLQPFVIQQLFKTDLVELKATKPAVAQKTNSISMLGENRKHIVIVVESPDNVYLPENELNFLIGILSACQLNMEDAGIINIDRNKGLAYQLFGSEIPAKKVLLFGTTPGYLQLPLSFPFYQLQSYNGVTYLCAPALTSLMQDKAEKTKLWNSLKQLFNL